MSNEIKQGDMVRVSEDAPKMYFREWDTIFKSNDCNVLDVEDDNAAIAYSPYIKAVPTKYLVKVDAEAFRMADVVSDAGLHQDNYLNEDKKEAEFKVGDKVVVHYPNSDRIGRIQEEMLDGTYDIDYGGGCTGHNITRSQIEPYTTPIIKVGDRVRSKGYALEAVVLGINGDYIAVRRDDGIKQEWKRYMTELVEPTEQAEEDARIRQMEAELDEFRKAQLERILHPEKPIFEVVIDNVAMNWQRYEADLAKDIAIKITNKHMDGKPEDIGAYAVSVAKAVVEGLKRK